MAVFEKRKAKLSFSSASRLCPHQPALVKAAQWLEPIDSVPAVELRKTMVCTSSSDRKCKSAFVFSSTVAVGPTEGDRRKGRAVWGHGDLTHPVDVGPTEGWPRVRCKHGSHGGMTSGGKTHVLFTFFLRRST